MNTSVLLIDDDTELCYAITRLLAADKIDVCAAHTASAGQCTLLSMRFDLIILDVMLPDGDGFTLLKEIRGRSDIPVIMLTARGDAGDRIAGLEFGADDYVPKPFVAAELVARIRAVLRRRVGGRGNLLVAGDVEIEIHARRVLRRGEEVNLTSAEFDILVALVRRTGECVTREELSEHALGRPVGLSDRSIDNHISNLRRKLGTQSGGTERIRSIRNLGYCYTRDARA